MVVSLTSGRGLDAAELLACSWCPAAEGDVPDLARLVDAVQDLSLARDVPAIMAIVRTAARELTRADGASFVLRDGDLCHYADEDAILPLWKSRRFPMSACISGWVMLHGEPIAIEDVYADPRIPADVYAPTFVKSLAMVPIRTKAPIGAIGCYWAERHAVTGSELRVLQALADSTSVAMESVEIHGELERRIRERTRELEAAHRELLAQHDALVELQRQKDALSALVVHDLKSPASAILLSASMKLRAADLPAAERRRWIGVLSSAEQIHRTALNLLDIAASEEGRLSPRPAPLDLGALFAEIQELFAPIAERRGLAIEIRCDLPPGALSTDRDLLRRVLQNLVDNALRHAPAGSAVRLEALASDAGVEIAVRDEGPGVPRAMRDRVFDAHAQLGERGGDAGATHGLGLRFCRLAVEALGGAVWIDDNEPRGSRFCLRLPRAAR